MSSVQFNVYGSEKDGEGTVVVQVSDTQGELNTIQFKVDPGTGVEGSLVEADDSESGIRYEKSVPLHASAPTGIHPFAIMNDLTVEDLPVWTFGADADTRLFANGTASAPGIAFSADPDTGIWRNAPDEMSLVAGGSTRLRLGVNASIYEGGTSGVWLNLLSGAGASYRTSGVLFSHDGMRRWSLFKSGEATPSLMFSRYDASGDLIDTPFYLHVDGRTFVNNELVVHGDRIVHVRGARGTDENEHLTFGKVGSASAGNPYYTWKTDAGAVPAAYLVGWDNAKSRIFLRADFGNNTLELGNLDTSPPYGTVVLRAGTFYPNVTTQLGTPTNRWGRYFGGDLVDSAVGTTNTDREHFRWGRSGGGSPGNPYYVLKTSEHAVPRATLSGWDDAVSRTFLTFDFENTRMYVADTGILVVLAAGDDAPDPAHLYNGSFTAFLDQDADQLKFMAKYADGSVQTFSMFAESASSPTSITITPQPASVAIGETVQFTVMANYDVGAPQNVTSQAVLTPTGGTITAGGLYTAGNAEGGFSVGAAYLGFSDLSEVNVAAQLVSITVTPDGESVTNGGDLQFTVTANYNTGPAQNVTSQAVLTAAGGTITAGGLYTAGNTEGAFTVSAAFGGLSDSAVVNVTVDLVSLAITPNPASVEQAKTRQFTLLGTWSDGSVRDHTSAAQWDATGGTISGSGLYTADWTMDEFSVEATYDNMVATATVNVTVLTQYFTDFSLVPTGEVMPDLARLRVSDSAVGWEHQLVVRADAGATGGKILKLEGPAVTAGSPPTTSTMNNGDSRPYTWLAVPQSTVQESLVKLRITGTFPSGSEQTGWAAGGAIVSSSINGDEWNYQEYGARLTHGLTSANGVRFQLWRYYGTDNTFATPQNIDAPDILANEWVWIRLRRDGTGVFAKYWRDAVAEPASWQLSMAHVAAHPAGYPGLYTNTVASGVEYDIMSIAIEGQTAAKTGTPVSTTTPTPTLTGAAWADDFESHSVGDNPPAGWTKLYNQPASNNWTVTQDGSHKILRCTSGSGRAFLDVNAVFDSTQDQEILVRLRSAGYATNGNGVALKIEPPPSDSAYCVELKTTGFGMFSFLSGNYTPRTAIPAAHLGNAAVDKWIWMRARLDHTTGYFYAKVWLATEPEPFKWMQRSPGITSLASGSPGLYHFAGHTTDYDDVQVQGITL